MCDGQFGVEQPAERIMIRTLWGKHGSHSRYKIIAGFSGG